MDLFEVQRRDSRLDGALSHGRRVLWGRSAVGARTGLAVAGDESTGAAISRRGLAASQRYVRGEMSQKQGRRVSEEG